MCREIRDELHPMVTAQVTGADQRIAELRAFRDRLGAALLRLRQLPAKDGPCDPTCAFLHEPVAIACSLDGGRYADRVERWREMLGDAPRVRTAEGDVVAHVPASRAGALADLVVAEQECCPFLTFHMAFTGTHVELTAGAPTTAEPLIATLFQC